MNDNQDRTTGRRASFYELTGISRENASPGWKQEPAGAGGYFIMAVTGGSGTMTIDGESYAAELGKCYLAAPASDACLESAVADASFYLLRFEVLKRQTDGQISARDFSFPDKPDHCEDEPSRDPGAAKETLLEPGEIVCASFASCVTMLETIYDLRHPAGEFESFDAHVRFYEFLRFLLQQRAVISGGLDAMQAVERSIVVIRDNYRSTLTVKGLASDAGLDRWKYSRLFKERTGTTPLDFLNRIRIERTKELLILTDDPLSGIADHAGFNNEYYLNRRFKQTVGITPGQYRRNHREQIRVFAPYLEDFLLALEIKPFMQWYCEGWGKQDYLGMSDVPVFDVSEGNIEPLAKEKPDFILLDAGTHPSSYSGLAPTYKMAHPGEDWRSTLDKLADLFGKKSLVKDIVGEYESSAAQAREALGLTVRDQTVAFLRISAEAVTLYGGQEHGYTGPVLYRDLGLTPHRLVSELTGRSRRSVALTPEGLARLDADHLFVTYDRRFGHTAGIHEDERLAMLPGIRGANVYEVDFLTWMNYGILSRGKKIDDVLKVLA
ncbi:AraC family transcriptional regulator [Paenibacillus sp. UNC499MF]|uniref:AraC family transcriptional regulator n=1 Tax=Paenibacillus sp. UNC499MF TaxID=1502751 RepID=UPI0008A037CA|nr:AraC family transcriptional regulator [Paenibacillus sp. UNC499MF]SEG75036.1 AraC-type DNA-binding protein [Paenibacillus sp. UNC499MF]